MAGVFAGPICAKTAKWIFIDKLDKSISERDPVLNNQTVCSMMRSLTVVISRVHLEVQFGFQDIRHSLRAHNTSDAAVTAHFVLPEEKKKYSALLRIDILPLNFRPFFPLRMTSTVSNSLFSTWQEGGGCGWGRALRAVVPRCLPERPAGVRQRLKAASCLLKYI